MAPCLSADFNYTPTLSISFLQLLLHKSTLLMHSQEPVRSFEATQTGHQFDLHTANEGSKEAPRFINIESITTPKISYLIQV